ncbi:MAG: 3-methyl-2-oxobutanoate hydroxymethyltransferase, partial [Victivallales bacterium]|nr:3-methyl-2-oxobutanoate hydroxymethyltransferase [Victivallales bacterium]
MAETASNSKLTVRSFRKMKLEGVKITALTAYDAPTARFAERCGVDMILVGDSLGMTVLGYDTTIPVTIEQSLHHCAAVVRGVEKAFVVGDMPFMTYRTGVETALLNAARYLQEAGVDAVKFEGGADIAETVSRMTAAGVPVLGHIGLLPQKVKTAGGYHLAGKTNVEERNLISDAAALQEAGAFAVVLEGIPAEAAGRITESLDIPTIGIGAGALCDGQIQVVNDILGL